MIYAFLGASGSGKTSLANYLNTLGIPRAISWTTRKPRENEKEGINYYFVDKPINETITKDKHRGNWYGTCESELLKAENIYCEMSLKGIKQLKERYKENIKVIYVYCKAEICFHRLINRDGYEKAMERMKYAYEEEEFNNIEIADIVLLNNSIEDFELNKKILNLLIKE